MGSVIRRDFASIHFGQFGNGLLDFYGWNLRLFTLGSTGFPNLLARLIYKKYIHNYYTCLDIQFSPSMAIYHAVSKETLNKSRNQFMVEMS